MHAARPAATAVLLSLLVACESPPPTGMEQDEPLPVCADGTELAVTGPAPTVSWTPECAAHGFFVRGPGVFWAVLGSPLAPIEPPLDYGDVPEGTITLGFDDPLREGEEYEVRLEVRSGTELLGRDTVATAVYVP